MVSPFGCGSLFSEANGFRYPLFGIFKGRNTEGIGAGTPKETSHPNMVMVLKTPIRVSEDWFYVLMVFITGHIF